MIEIPAKAWKYICTIGVVLGFGAVVVLMAGIGSEAMQQLCLCFLILLGFSGASAALFERLGVLCFMYSEKDKRGFFFRLSQHCAASEKQIWGTIFSAKYYENYLGELEEKTTKPKDGE
jgi:hypothetical protein